MAFFLPTSFWASGVESIVTPFTKALSFFTNANAVQNSNSTERNPIRMGDQAVTVNGPSTVGNTSDDSNSKPFALSIIFKLNSSAGDQYILNQGEGSGGNDDNIFIRRDSSNKIYFGWGRNADKNELYILTADSTNWYGIYVGYNGARWSSADATTTNLASTFDVRYMSSADSFVSLSSNQSTVSNWGGSDSSVGAQMDRDVTGDLSVGSRGSGDYFKGEVTSTVITTLQRDVAMPNGIQIKKIIKDPLGWLNVYKIGQSYRLPNASTTTSDFQLNDTSSSAYASQVWIFGDGANDTFTDQFNQVNRVSATLTPTEMKLIASNTLSATVNIPGLTS